MEVMEKVISQKSSEQLVEYLYDPAISEYSRMIALELIERLNKKNIDIDTTSVYECMSYLSMGEVIDFMNSDNSYLAYVAFINLNDRMADTKNNKYFNDAKARTLKKQRMNKRGKRLGYDK